MQALAAWLVARPRNAVLALAVTTLLLAPQLTSGAIMALLVLRRGAGQAAFIAAMAAGVLAAGLLLVGESVASIAGLIASTWLPAMLLAVLLASMRSLTLTIQVSVILAVLGLIGFNVVVTDPTAFWQPYLTVLAEVFQQRGVALDTASINGEMMTVSATLAYWLMYVGALLLGYGLYRNLPGETGNFGRFRELNLGRVIALILALVSVLGAVVDSTLVHYVAFVMFVMFWLQGLAIVHWLHAEQVLPLGAVVAIYVLLPFVHVLLVTVLAVLGYMDAWFKLRRRFKKA